MRRHATLLKRLASCGLCATMFASALAYFPSDTLNTLTASADSLVSLVPREHSASAYTVTAADDLIKRVETLSTDSVASLEITLGRNIALNDGLAVGSGKTLTLNLNGYELSCNTQLFSVRGTLNINGGDGRIAVSASSLITAIWIYDGAEVDVSQTKFLVSEVPTIFFVQEGGNLTLNNSTISSHRCPNANNQYFSGSVYNAGEFTMNSGALNNSSDSAGTTGLPLLTNTSTGVFNANGGTIGGNLEVINQGKIRCSSNTFTTFNVVVRNTGMISGGNYANQVINSASATIWGGTFSSINPAYTVTFNTNGGSTAPASQIRYNAPITVPSNPTKGGYTFTGWYSDGETLWDNEARVTSNLYLVAGWKDAQAPTISGITNGGKYCLAKTFTVSDNVGVTSVTVNGTSLTPTNGVYSLPASDSAQTIAVKDAANNTTTYSVYVYPSHTYNSDGECSVCGESDSTPPVIAGIENNGKYCKAVEFTVTDESAVSSVTANGSPLNANSGVYTLSAGENESISIVATDVKGNATTYTIQLYASHTYENGECKICGEDDKEAPTITGIENNGVYCISAEFTVSDNAGIGSVVINGETATAVNGKYTINAAASMKQTIIVTDVSGNIAVCYVTVHESHIKGDDGKCSVCSGFIDGLTAHPAGHTISLGGNIGVNFYMELDADVIADTGAYMLFTLPNGTTSKVYVKDVQTDTTTTAGTTYYIFSCEVAAKDMYETIKTKIVLSDGSSGDEYTFKVEDYANYILNDENGFDQKTKDLVTAMLSYGNYAKAYFNDQTLAASSEIEAVTANALVDYAVTTSGTLPEGIEYYGSTLILEAQTAIRHYFRVAEGTDISAYHMTAKDGFYYVQISNIAADDLGTAQTTTIGDFTISYSALSYAYAALNSDSVSDSLNNLVKALALYQQAATAYQATDDDVA